MAARSSSRSLARCRNDTTARAEPGADGQRGDEGDHRRPPVTGPPLRAISSATDGTVRGLGTHLPGPDRGLEDAGGQVDAGVEQLVEELGPQAGRLDLADLAAVGRHAGHEAEELLEQDDVALEALHLFDGDDAAGAVRRPLELDDDVDGRGDLLADGPDRQLEAGHQHHGLEPGQGVAGGVGVDGGDRAGVTGVHGLEHVEGLAATDLADDDPVGPHPQGVADEVPDADLAAALGVGRAGLEPHDVGLLELELGGVLDGDDPLPLGDERRQHVERRGLAGARTAGDEDVELAPHAGLEEQGEVHGQRPEVDEVGRRCRGPRRTSGSSASAPLSDSGGMMALTREPSGRRASTMGLDSSTRRPTALDDLVDHLAVLGRRR